MQAKLLTFLKKESTGFIGVGLIVFLVVQLSIKTGFLDAFWAGIVFWGATITILALGLNLIYGFNGQFSLGQYGFYAIGAYASADITYRWNIQQDPTGLAVGLSGALLTLLCYIGISALLRRFYRVNVMTHFIAYLLGTALCFFIAVKVLAAPLGAIIGSGLMALPVDISPQVVFFCALVSGTAIAGIASYLFGIPVLELGSDYFGISTLGFTIIVKVLLDNADAVFPEMQGARGMTVPKLTTWPWIFFSLLAVVVVMRNLLHSSVGRAIVSVREDERAAELVGVNVASSKLLAFVVGSAFAGLAGGLRAHDMAFLHPQSFNFIQSFNPLIIVVFGGLGSMTGTLFTGFAWIILLEGLLRNLPEGYESWRFVVYPLVLLLMMLLRPEGLLGKYELPFLRRSIPPKREKSEEVAR